MTLKISNREACLLVGALYRAMNWTEFDTEVNAKTRKKLLIRYRSLVEKLRPAVQRTMKELKA